jgi:hypothetical protein
MALSGNVFIDIIGPPYSETFSGTSTRVHVRGHLWLKADSTNFVVTFKIQTGGFVFDDGGTGNAKKAIFTSAQPNPNSFSKCGGAFGDPTLSNGNMWLTITLSNNDSNKYFYQLNFLDTHTQPSTAFHTNDPIMVNN